MSAIRKTVASVKKQAIAFDIALKRPGCPILQAVYGNDPSIAHAFPPESWLLAPTPDLKVYSLQEQELRMLTKIVAKNMELSKAA